MKYLIKFEEAALFILGIYAFHTTGYSWWLFIFLIFLPDLSILGYIFSNRTGTFLYNLFHHKGIAVLIYLTGICFHISWIELSGIILFSHSCIDRFFGYGLKYNKGFSYTHLGIIGKNKKN